MARISSIKFRFVKIIFIEPLKKTMKTHENVSKDTRTEAKENPSLLHRFDYTNYC